MGIIYWPGDIGRREQQAIKKVHGAGAIVEPYEIDEAYEPFGIVNLILADPTSFVYVPSGVHALIASERRLKFGLLTYCRSGLEAIHHFDPHKRRPERLWQVWAWRKERFAESGVSLN